MRPRQHKESRTVSDRNSITRRIFVGASIAAIAIPAGRAGAQSGTARSGTISGHVVYRERMALPPGAVVNVKLVDVSLADAPSRTLAETTVPAGTGSPIAYRLEYDPDEIKDRARYALQARITIGDQLLFINDTHHPFESGNSGEMEIQVVRVVGSKDAVQSPAGKWLAEDIQGGGVIDRIQTVLEVREDGAVSGSGGCNRFAGKATISGDTISFSPLVSTEMACSPAVMDQEQKFHAALVATKAFRIHPLERKLVLLDGAGKAVARFSAM